MASLVAGEPSLRDRVYIPRIYRELSSKRVLTVEWIEGVRLWDKEAITRPWQGGWLKGSPGCGGTPLDDSNSNNDENDKTTGMKPERNYWRGPDGKGGLGVSLQSVMTTMVDLFSAQMFLWGYVHCDPHPGNIFIRRQPSATAAGKPELVLIDHGLYIHMPTGFRRQYAEFWKALMTFDNATLRSIVSSWGVKNVDLFASATLMRPYRGGDLSTRDSLHQDLSLSPSERAQRHYELQQKARQAVRDILGDETRWPRELLFIGRNLRIVMVRRPLPRPIKRIYTLIILLLRPIISTWARR